MSRYRKKPVEIEVQGERYPVKPDIFAATYEPVDGEQ